MTINKIIKIAAKAYPDEYLLMYWHVRKQRPKEGSGDGLARFIVQELYETYDADATDACQLEEAKRVMANAMYQLQAITEAMDDEHWKAYLKKRRRK